MDKVSKRDVPDIDVAAIVKAVIHPGIGVARLGNSRDPDGFFIGPETVERDPDSTVELRDDTGAIKRQAARFRIYSYDAHGNVVGELTADNAQIDWQVHLVNRKAQWFKFDTAMDIPESALLEVPLRNAHVKGAARDALAIDPGARSINGKNKSGKGYQFDSGEFMGVNVPLGELRTDADGRLLVLGGYALSGSPTGKPIYAPDEPGSFPNATEWFDDTSDGPVQASVVINGKSLPVDSAWVIAAQPDFAPHVVGWRTLYDLLIDTYCACGWMQPPKSVSFVRDVLPVLQRLSGLQWVNKGFVSMFGHGAPMDFTNPQLLSRLSRSDDTYSHLRRSVFNAFRAADNNVHEQRTWPWLYGDSYGGEGELARNHLAISSARSDLLRRWVAGEFVNDWVEKPAPPGSFEDLPIAEQPAMLDKAALHFCLADAFHPGIELSWPMRHASMYRAPFRIRQMPDNQPMPDFGAQLNQRKALSDNGPLYAQPPGGLSRWMALPWQIDTVGCRSGYDRDYDPYLPSFWPAQVPDQVLSEADYSIVMDASRDRESRLAAFNRRAHWGRQVKGSFVQQAMQVVADVSVLGIVESRPGVVDDADFPGVMQVEIERARPEKPVLKSASMDARDAGFAEAGWESAEQYEEFCRILKR